MRVLNIMIMIIYSQCSAGNQFPVQVTYCNLSTRELVGGFVLFLIEQSFESELRQDSPLCFQDSKLIIIIIIIIVIVII